MPNDFPTTTFCSPKAPEQRAMSHGGNDKRLDRGLASRVEERRGIWFDEARRIQARCRVGLRDGRAEGPRMLDGMKNGVDKGSHLTTQACLESQ